MGESKPVWLEEWQIYDDERGGICVAGRPNNTVVPCDVRLRSEQDMRLIAAAPALVRALLRIEWSKDDWTTRNIGVCPRCRLELNKDWPGHASGCQLDAALTAAGLDTQAKRDAIREAMK
jgi:hypothetical protein